MCGTEVPEDTNSNFNEFWTIYPNRKNKVASEAIFTEAVSGGADPVVIIAAAKSYALENKGNDKQYIKHSDNWLKAECWRNFEAELVNVKTDPHTVARKTAQNIIDRKPWVANTVSTSMAYELISLRLVTQEQCKAAGVAA